MYTHCDHTLVRNHDQTKKERLIRRNEMLSGGVTSNTCVENTKRINGDKDDFPTAMSVKYRSTDAAKSALRIPSVRGDMN